MARLDANTLFIVKDSRDIIVGAVARPADIGNRIKAFAEDTAGDYSAVAGATVTALQQVNDFAKLLGKVVPKATGALAVVAIGVDVVAAQNDIDRFGYVRDATWLSLAGSVAAGIGLVAGAVIAAPVTAAVVVAAATVTSISLSYAALSSDLGEDSDREILDAFQGFWGDCCEQKEDFMSWAGETLEVFEEKLDTMLDMAQNGTLDFIDPADSTRSTIPISTLFTSAQSYVVPPHPRYYDPLVFDLDGDGIETVAPGSANTVLFEYLFSPVKKTVLEACRER
jgi:hypothetical protein